ncbi:MAG: hypothetical protein LBV34_22065 [Nocardiopsaceae bacterium]|jgi:hypothetical protein|nr:hypothetical protein [Nocardiopsaceae bacterium]
MRNVGDGAGRHGIGPGYDRAGYDDGGYGQSAYSGGAWPEDDLGSAYSWSTDDPDAWPGMSVPGRSAAPQAMASNAARGFPPAPGDPLPVYPPGPFAAWNIGQPGRTHGRGDQSGRSGLTDSSQLATATITPDEFDTDYSLPAIKDPIPAGGRTAFPDRRRLAAQSSQAAAQKVRTDQFPAEPAPAVSHGGRSAAKRSRSAGRTRKKRAPAWLAIGAATGIIAAVAVVLAFRVLPHGSSPAPRSTPSSTPSPTSSSPKAPPGQWGFIGSRKTDPVALTAAELFPYSVSNAGTAYTRVNEAKGTNCRRALIGSDLQAAVRSGGCKQTLRATYVSKSAKVMGTIGVFNLKTFPLASKAARKAGRNEFVAQLAAKAGPAKSIGQGTGLEEAVVKGHYLVLVWAENTNLNAPKTQAGRARLTAFMNFLVKHTVNVSLSNRMVDGKPIATGRRGGT